MICSRRILLAALAAAPLFAADATGDWYGALDAMGNKLRLVLHLTQSSGKVSVVMDSIDQGAMGMAAATASLDGNKLKAEWPSLRASYEADVNADGTEIKGTFTQAGSSFPLAFTREKFATNPSQPLSAEDRDFLLSHLEKSKQEFLKSLDGITPEQWSFKPSSGGWSIAECAEHLTTTENAIFDLVTNRLLKAPVGAAPRRTRADDQKIIDRYLDRSQKNTAPEMLKPSGKWPNRQAMTEEFTKRRDASIAFLKTTQEDLRGRIGGQMDAYQYLLMMSAHTLRHTMQLNEVKQDPKYPK
ncbi:MAG: DinB family protein [Bryobacteraceae bacterium]|nr:DinB family protein [Bryobacteraceae bacterium]